MTLDPFDRVVDLLGGLRNGMARCPAHEDGSPSLSVTRGKTHPVVLKCHAGCATADILNSLSLTPADICADDRSGPSRQPEVVNTYRYVDESNRLLFSVLRYEPGFDGKRRSFVQRPANGKRGPGAMDGVRRVLYRLPEVLDAAARREVVYVVEGEKDVDRLRSAGVTATCNPAGAGKWRSVADGSRSLVGAAVVIVADKDEPGYRHAAEVVVSLLEVGVVPSVVEAVSGKDAADHLGAGHKVDEFVPLASGRPGVKEWARAVLAGESPSPPAGDDPAEEPAPWETPVPLDDVRPVGLPSFPLEALPEIIRRQAVDVAESVGASVDIAAVAGLGALAVLAAPTLEVQVAQTWRSPTSLYLVTIERSGGGKSPLFRAMREPIESYQAELTSAWQDQEYERTALREANDGERKRIKAKLADGDRTQIARYAELNREHDELAADVSPRVYLSDVTPEALVDEMAEQGGAVAVWTDEGSVFDHAAGVYSERPSLDILKRGIDGEPYTRRRRNGGATTIPRCVLTIVVATQPVTIEEIGKGSHGRRLSGEGVLARFLYVWPAESGPKDHQLLGGGNRAIRERYTREVLDWVRALRGNGPTRLFLTPEALYLLNDWANQLEQLSQPDQLLADMREWVAKAKGSAARIAALLASFDGAEEVDENAMRRALTIAGYFLEHARFVYGRWTSGPTTRDAALLLDTIRSKWAGETTVAARDLWRSVRRTFDEEQGPKAMTAALGLLADLGWLRGPDDWERDIGKRGKAVVFEICPALWLSPMSPTTGETNDEDPSKAA